MPVHDLRGMKFGRLTVISFDQIAHRGAKWWCICECGKLKSCSAHSLKGGNTLSCGCLFREKNARIFTKHGLCGTPEYRAWKSMNNRCTNPNHPKYYLWGGRGITVCERWRHSFEAFYADMGPRPQGGGTRGTNYSLDRINNDGNYEPGNCRWATMTQQLSNKRTSKKRLPATITK